MGKGSNVVIFGVTRQTFFLMAADELKASKFYVVVLTFKYIQFFW